MYIGNIVPEQIPKKDRMARHNVRIRYKGEIARALGNPPRGSLIRIRSLDEEGHVRETVYRVVLYDIYMMSNRIRMDYDTMVELGVQNDSANQKHAGNPVRLEVMRCDGLFHKLMYLWDHPDENIRIATQAFVLGIIVMIPIEFLINIITNHL